MSWVTRPGLYFQNNRNSGIIVGRKIISRGKIISRDAKLWTVILFNV